MAIEEGQLLGAVGRVIGRIEVDRDLPGAPMQALPVPVNDALGQLAPHRIEGLAALAVFKARQRRLRRQRRAGDGVAAQQQLVDRIVGELVRVIGIGVPAGDPDDPLGQQVAQRVLGLPRLPLVDQAAGKAIDQPVARFRGLEQDRAAIRARVRLIERRDEGFVEEAWEENSLWYRVVAQAKASVVGKSSSANGFVPCGGFCVSTEIGHYVNYPG